MNKYAKRVTRTMFRVARRTIAATRAGAAVIELGAYFDLAAELIAVILRAIPAGPPLLGLAVRPRIGGLMLPPLAKA